MKKAKQSPESRSAMMTHSNPLFLFVPGEVLALLSPLQELDPGLYLLQSLTDGWAVLRLLIDDEATERILMTEYQKVLPVRLLEFFMPVGLTLTSTA